MVDEEAIGSVDRPGCGAKILRGDGALDQYITRTNVMNLQVWYLMSRNINTMISLGLGDQDHIYFPLIFIFVISLVALGLKWSFPFCFTNICYGVQETNDGLAGELEEAYMLSRIVSL